jgi:hypothetical protein
MHRFSPPPCAPWGLVACVPLVRAGVLPNGAAYHSQERIVTLSRSGARVCPGPRPCRRWVGVGPQWRQQSAASVSVQRPWWPLALRHGYLSLAHHAHGSRWRSGTRRERRQQAGGQWAGSRTLACRHARAPCAHLRVARSCGERGDGSVLSAAAPCRHAATQLHGGGVRDWQ